MSDVVLKTIIAEAGGDPDAMAAVAAVINNRAAKEGKTPEQIVKERGQFEGYSNPGPASVRAQNDPQVRATAQRVWSGVKSGTIADPTNGATMYHADYVKPYWAKSANKNGTVNIGGNIFYKGTGSPQTALAAINDVAPNPQQRPPALAYSQSPASVRAISVNPNGSPASLLDALNAKYSSVRPTTAADAPGIYSGFNMAPPTPPPALTSRSVQTVPIDRNGNPPGTKQDLQTALNAYAAQQAQRPPPPVPQANMPDLQTALNAYAAKRAQSNPNIQPTGTGARLGITPAQQKVIDGGYYALHPDERPTQLAMNTSGSPDDRSSVAPYQVASAPPMPMPGRPADIIRNVPYVPPAPPKQTNATGAFDVGALGLTSDPFRPQPPAVKAIQQATTKTVQVLNPAYTAWQASQTPALKSGQAYTATGSIIPQSMADAMRAVPSSAYMKPAPPKYIPQTVRVPTVPSRAPASIPLSSFDTVNPMSQIGPNIASHFASSPAGHLFQLLSGEPVQGGLLGMLFGGRSPAPGVVPAASVPATPPKPSTQSTYESIMGYAPGSSHTAQGGGAMNGYVF